MTTRLLSFSALFLAITLAFPCGLCAQQSNVFDQQAIDIVQKKIKEKPDPRGYLTLGMMYEKNGDTDKAIQAYKDSVALDQNYANGYQALAMVYARTGRWSESEKTFQLALALKPNDGELINNLAATYQLQKKYDLAIEMFKKALALDPDNLNRRMRLAQAYMLTGRDGEAIAAYEEILKINPDVVGAHNNLVVLYEKVGQKDKAGEHSKWIEMDQNRNVEKMKKAMKGVGYHADITQSGNIMTIKPTYYEEGKTPITSVERNAYNEFKNETAQVGNNEQQRQKILRKLTAKYNVTEEDFVYLLLKVEYNEIPPDNYRAPSEK